MIRIQGHRGFSELYPENTMIAFQKCYETGAFGIEMDVRITADKQYVIIHDETVDRTTDGTGTVKFINYNGYIDSLDAGSWFGAQFAGIKVPTLDEVLTEFQNKDIKLILHFYFTGTSMVSDVQGAIDKIVAKGMISKVHVFGEVNVINAAKAYNGHLYTLNSGLATISTYQGILDNAIANNHNAVSITSNANDADLTTMITAIHNAKKQVHVSYLSGSYESRVQRFIDYDADFVLGNNPQLMQNYVNSLEPPLPSASQAKNLIRADLMINKSYGLLKPAFYVVKSYGIVKVDTHRTFGEEAIEVITTNVECVGDSNTYGLYLAPADTYPSQLQTMVDPDVKVLNKGISGNRVADVVARLTDIISNKLAGAKNIIVLQIGTNDATDGRTASAIFNDINLNLIVPLQDEGFKVWSVTVPPRGDSTAANTTVKSLNTLLRNNPYPDRIIDFYPHMVDETDTFIPSMYGSDKKHLSKEGAGVIATLVAQQLETI